MEAEETIDVYEILRECAKEDMKLWSPVVGECTLKRLRAGVKQIIVNFTDRNRDTSEWKFNPDGKTYSVGDNDSAEVCLFPSKEMRDWEKIMWKKGDVLCNVEGNEVMFDKWDDSDYSSFRALFDIIPDGAGFKISKDTEGYSTKGYWKTNDSIREDFLATIEKHAHYKFNEETKEFEPYFKDGDVMYIPEIEKGTYPVIFIFKEIANGNIYDHASLVFENRYSPRLCVDDQNTAFESDKKYMRPATDEQKQQLFDELEKVGKRWNAKTKQIEDVEMNKEHEFKPFDRVLVRDEPDDYWQANLFACMNGKDPIYQFACVSEVWKQCIPYNEKTAHLLGTNDDYEEE